jgi:hypothetical protein
MFTFYRWLSMHGNSFLVCSACDKIVSAYAQHTHAIIFEMTQKSPIKMQISPKKTNFEKPSRNPSKTTKVKILKKKFFWISLKKHLVLRMLSQCRNVRTSKFCRKSKEKKQNFFRKFIKGINKFDLGQKKFKIISCLCTFKDMAAVSCADTSSAAGYPDSASLGPDSPPASGTPSAASCMGVKHNTTTAYHAYKVTAW